MNFLTVHSIALDENNHALANLKPHLTGYIFALAIYVNYLDFTKAFGKVEIGVTLKKLKTHCIRGQLMGILLNWQKTILADG